MSWKPFWVSAFCSFFAAVGPLFGQGGVGEQLEPFQLDDYRGTPFQLSDVEDAELVVVSFLGTECPLATLYAPRLQKIADEYREKGVVVLGINSNSQDNVTEIGAYVRHHGIKFPMLKDVGNRVADQFGAVRTPEVFVLDRDRTIRYRGRIDDQYGVGFQRDKPKVNDLKKAMEELLAGKPVTTPVTEGVGCHIGRIKQPIANGSVTYCNQISRILQNRCVVCHREGEIGPFHLTDYDEVAGWADMIEEVVREERMPPWNASREHGSFANSRYLSDEEKELIYQWVADGAPKGDESLLPTPRKFTKGWQLPKQPDDIFKVSEKPFQVRANGSIRYKYFSIDPEFKEDKWISAAQLLPGNHRVVHHILAFAIPEGKSLDDLGEGIDGFLVGYVPGVFAEPFPNGMAKRIPAGSRIVFQVHYTPIGTEQTDWSQLGLIYADPDEITHEVVTTSGFQTKLRIPPNDDSYKVNASSHRPLGESLLLGFMPHMHLRGKSFRYELNNADGSSEILLGVPKYDFNWQLSYRLSEPRKLELGSRINVFAEFDNSDGNIHNPDPNETVRWGDQTYEEMMIGYFDIAIPMDDPLRKYELDRLIFADRIMRSFDKNRDGKIEKAELPNQFQRRFSEFDQDEDGGVAAWEAAEIRLRR